MMGDVDEYCNCGTPRPYISRLGGVSWHVHGTRSTCPPELPVQDVCSPSLSAMGVCRCPRHRRDDA